MATYLATATNGRFRLEQSSVAGVPSYVAVDPREARDSRRRAAQAARDHGLLRLRLRPLPLLATGAVVDRAPFVGYALETQTKPVFDRAPNDVLIAHGSPTSGSATRSRSPAGRTSGSTRALRPGPSGCARTPRRRLARARIRDAYSVAAKRHGFWDPPPGNPGARRSVRQHDLRARRR